MLNNPSPPLVERDIFSEQNAPKNKTPDEEDGTDEDERVEADRTNKRNPEPDPGAVVLKSRLGQVRI